jgi:hypothetical protein
LKQLALRDPAGGRAVAGSNPVSPIRNCLQIAIFVSFSANDLVHGEQTGNKIADARAVTADSPALAPSAIARVARALRSAELAASAATSELSQTQLTEILTLLDTARKCLESKGPLT